MIVQGLSINIDMRMVWGVLFMLIMQGLSIHIVVGRVWLRTGFLFGFERGRILRELPLPSLRGLWLIMQGLSINIVVVMVWGVLFMSQL